MRGRRRMVSTSVVKQNVDELHHLHRCERLRGKFNFTNLQFGFESVITSRANLVSAEKACESNLRHRLHDIAHSDSTLHIHLLLFSVSALHDRLRSDHVRKNEWLHAVPIIMFNCRSRVYRHSHLIIVNEIKLMPMIWFMFDLFCQRHGLDGKKSLLPESFLRKHDWEATWPVRCVRRCVTSSYRRFHGSPTAHTSHTCL